MMPWKRKRLLEQGVEAQAVVLKVDSVQSQSQGTYHMRLDFPDGGHVEWKEVLWSSDTGVGARGTLLPVRYDPADRERVTVDVPRLRAERDRREAEQREEAIASSQAAARGEDPNADISLEELQRRIERDLL
ncbi:MAG: hypothetical protein QOH23_1067 [Gaiellaceae bacterium]|nr:hypothetical protein [Gaiellaceae bacterium]